MTGVRMSLTDPDVKGTLTNLQRVGGRSTRTESSFHNFNRQQLVCSGIGFALGPLCLLSMSLVLPPHEVFADVWTVNYTTVKLASRQL